MCSPKDWKLGGILNWISIQPNNNIKETEETNDNLGKIIAHISRKMEANEYIKKIELQKGRDGK